MKNGLMHVRKKVNMFLVDVKKFMKKYPYCRPLHRINSGTPRTEEIKKKYGSKKLRNVKENSNDKKDDI